MEQEKSARPSECTRPLSWSECHANANHGAAHTKLAAASMLPVPLYLAT
jgi:hypothetical protein